MFFSCEAIVTKRFVSSYSLTLGNFQERSAPHSKLGRISDDNEKKMKYCMRARATAGRIFRTEGFAAEC